MWEKTLPTGTCGSGCLCRWQAAPSVPAVGSAGLCGLLLPPEGPRGAGVAPSLFPSDPLFQGCGQTNISCKVVKGELVEVGKWPWQVSILFLGVYVCSGSLIHQQWVLTAAHCLQRSVRVAGPSRGLCFLAWGAGTLANLGFWE